MALTITTTMLRPKTEANGILRRSMQVVVKDDEAVVADETFSEACTPSEDPGNLAPIWKAKIQSLLDKCKAESDAHADPKYIAVAETCKVGLKGLKQ
jgi:hypothetical protein